MPHPRAEERPCLGAFEPSGSRFPGIQIDFFPESNLTFPRRPWTPGDYDRAVKSPKWFAADTGIMAALLDWSQKGVFFDPDQSGKLAETFAHHELAAEADLLPRVRLWHYRDEDKREVDFVLTDGDGRFLAVEVKAGSAVRSDDFRHIDCFRARFAPGAVGIVLHTGNAVLPFGSKRYAVPFGCLFGA